MAIQILSLIINVVLLLLVVLLLDKCNKLQQKLDQLLKTSSDRKKTQHDPIPPADPPPRTG